MTTPANEPDNSQGHPAWDPFLKNVPEEFHEYVKPAFAAWDEAVVPKSKLQELQDQYAAYEDFVKNEIDADSLAEAYGVRQALEENPEQFVRKAIEIFGLENVINAASSETPPSDNDEDFEFSEDITKHPAFKELQKNYEALASKQTTQEQKEQEAREAQEFDEYLSGLKETYKDAGNFDEAIVSGLIGAGWDGEEAVKHYFAVFGTGQQQQQQQEAPPVVMGGDGSTGSGIPQEDIKMGALDRNKLEDVVLQFIENAEKDN